MRKSIDLKWFSIDLEEQWSQFMASSQYNWLDFDMLQLSFEKENIHGYFEVELYILGLGIRVYWTYDEEKMQEKVKEYQAILDNPDQWVEAK